MSEALDRASRDAEIEGSETGEIEPVNIERILAQLLLDL
jgi:hypothetical protein